MSDYVSAPDAIAAARQEAVQKAALSPAQMLIRGLLAGAFLGYATSLALVILNFAGILTHERFRKWRRLLIFGVFAFAAVATPSPDPFTMLLLASFADLSCLGARLRGSLLR